MNKIRLSYITAVSGYFGLIALLLVWLGWLSPPQILPTAVAMFLMLVPLLFPLRGILYGRPYTFAWTGFLALFYFTHGVVEAYSTPADRWLALLEILLSIAFYIGSIVYARLCSKELKRQASK